MKNEIAALRKDIEAALVAVAQKHGLDPIKTGKAVFTDDTVEFKLMLVKTGGKNVEAQRYEDLQRTYEKVHASNPELPLYPPLNTELKHGKYHWKVIGCNTTGSKIFVTDMPTGRKLQVHAESIEKIWKVTLEQNAAKPADKA